MLKIPKALLERLIDHWAIPVGLKIQGEDAPDPQPDPQPDPGPGPSPEPDPSVGGLVYHTLDKCITGWSGEYGHFIKAYKPIELKASDSYELSVEAQSYPIIHQMYRQMSLFVFCKESYSLSYPTDRLYLYAYADGSYSVSCSAALSNSEGDIVCYDLYHLALPSNKYILKLKHEPGGLFTFSSQAEDGTIADKRVVTTTEPTPGTNFYVGNLPGLGDSQYMAGIYATDNTYIKINNKVVWTLYDEVIYRGIPSVDDEA